MIFVHVYKNFPKKKAQQQHVWINKAVSHCVYVSLRSKKILAQVILGEACVSRALQLDHARHALIILVIVNGRKVLVVKQTARPLRMRHPQPLLLVQAERVGRSEPLVDRDAGELVAHA